MKKKKIELLEATARTRISPGYIFTPKIMLETIFTQPFFSTQGNDSEMKVSKSHSHSKQQEYRAAKYEIAQHRNLSV